MINYRDIWFKNFVRYSFATELFRLLVLYEPPQPTGAYELFEAVSRSTNYISLASLL